MSEPDPSALSRSSAADAEDAVNPRSEPSSPGHDGTLKSDKPALREEEWLEINVRDTGTDEDGTLEGSDESAAEPPDLQEDGPSEEVDHSPSAQQDEEVSRKTSQPRPSHLAVDAASARSPTDQPLSGGQESTITDLESTAPTISINQRLRSDSRSTQVSRNGPVNSTVFVVTALETIEASREARRNKELGDAVHKALNNIKQQDINLDPEAIFLPLQLATKTFSIPLQVTALDCIGKLISYSYFSFPQTPSDGSGKLPEQVPLIERAIETICDCFENEATPPEIQQQIVKSLLAAILDDKIVVHGAGLLKAVRQIYNIFIYSKSSQNQMLAQGSLTQMISSVFERVKVRLDMKEARLRGSSEGRSDEDLSRRVSADAIENGVNGDGSTPDIQSMASSEQPVQQEAREKLTLQSFESNKNFDDSVVTDNAPTMVTRARSSRKIPHGTSDSFSRNGNPEDRDEQDFRFEDEEDEIFIKDAFLVFRSLCKLSQKVLPHDQQQDLRSQNMRSKLLSLHLIHYLLNNHISVFISPVSVMNNGTNGELAPFMQIAKPHLCLSLSRNASSSVPRVFEVCCEIFWLSFKHLRVVLKKESEVFLKEIYLAVLEKKTAPIFQKQYFMEVLERLSADPRALVEMYLNYDCDRMALDNMYQDTIEHLSRICSTPVTVTPVQQQLYQEQHLKVPTPSEWRQKNTLPPYLAATHVSHANNQSSPIPVDYLLKQQSLECLVEILQSLDNWSSQAVVETTDSQYQGSNHSMEVSREFLEQPSVRFPASPRISSADFGTGPSTPTMEDDPGQIENVKRRKTALNEAIRQFNFKAKRGIKTLIEQGFIPSDRPEDIAVFLLRNDRLDKSMIGEYLGEGDTQNVAIMHAFVDQMDFAKKRFVDALRMFLQSFRLPGEAQKIDRFMLKFAERYLTGNPNAFANADTAYVLAYSVIMLNTDQHSTKFKGRRMTKEDFIKNNRGINDGQDLPDEYLIGIFDEIVSNEIVLKTEREHAAALGIPVQAPAAGLASRAGQALANVGRDLQKEKYAQASEEMANKTEQLYRSLIKAQKRSAARETMSRFIPASSIKHVGSMFNVTWMSFLSGFSSQLQTTQNIEIVKQCMEGLRLAIRIACRFDLETPRLAFVTALARFTNLSNLKDMMAKNLEALKMLLDVALTEGNFLKESWREVLTCISQLDRFQLLSGGVEEGELPDVTRARIGPSGESAKSRKPAQNTRRPKPRSANSAAAYRPDIVMESNSAEMIRSVDRIFTNTANLTPEAIVDFVRALSAVSWQEIQSSGESGSPRMYSLQKLVEISYYNMTRVRIEWKGIWDVLGEHFNDVGCYNNSVVVFFALDSLRQLAKRFMDIEELPGFKFQKDFLKPFEHIIANSTLVTVKDMVLRCLVEMIQTRGDNIRSGWKTMFGVFSVAAQEDHESIVNLAFDYTTLIYNTKFGIVISQGAFADLIVCLTQFSKNHKFQKKSLQAIETLKSTVPKMLKTPECPLSQIQQPTPDVQANGSSSIPKQPNPHTQEEQFWYPVLIAYQDVLMTGEDLEVRSRASTYLFETLIRYGGNFPIEFWDVLWRQLLYPIFVVLQSKSEMSRAPNLEELSVWLSTTMIQALRNMMTLFTHYFESLERMLDRFLDLLALCICQENDTIARIGSNCLQQIILQNVIKFRPDHWNKIVGAFVDLFNRTTAMELFSAAATMSQARPPSISENSSTNGLAMTTDNDDDSSQANNIHARGTSLETSSNAVSNVEAQDASNSTADQANPDLEDYRPHSDLQHQPVVVTTARRRFFNKIITNCVLQLLMIETVNELFSNDLVYAQIPSSELLRLMGLLKKSYQFAKKFNGDKELRMQLWRQGFMKQPPNLLKQESGSAATYVAILLRMYHDEGEERKASRNETEAALVPLCADIIRSYVSLDEETQQRNIIAWRPVVVDVLDGYTHFRRDSFDKYIETFYPLGIELLSRDLGSEVRMALQGLLRRIGEVRLGMPPTPVVGVGNTPGQTPTSPSREFNWGRRRSSAR
ncbi:MAG: hypothetical protein Q9227_001589 [Pyrenula ochraceoflavens]